MDTVVFLSRPIGEDGQPDDTAIKLEFRKARLRTPANAEQFEPLIIRPGDEWQVETAPKETKTNGRESAQKIVEREFLAGHDRLADGVHKSPGFDSKPVAKVKVDAITAELKSRGFLQTNDKGNLTRAASTMLWKAKTALLRAGGPLVEDDGFIWRK